PACHSGIAIGHIGGGLFGMRKDRLHAKIIQLQQCPAHRRFDKEDMAHAGPGQGPRKPFRTVHWRCFTHVVSSSAQFVRTVPVRRASYRVDGATLQPSWLGSEATSPTTVVKLKTIGPCCA